MAWICSRWHCVRCYQRSRFDWYAVAVNYGLSVLQKHAAAAASFAFLAGASGLLGEASSTPAPLASGCSTCHCEKALRWALRAEGKLEKDRKNEKKAGLRKHGAAVGHATSLCSGASNYFG